MANITLTDKAYVLLERIDQEKRQLKVSMVAFFLSALFCSALSGYFYLVFYHQKDGLSDTDIASLGLLAFMCVVLLGIASTKLIKFAKINSKLGQIEALEDTIYREVLKSQDE